MGLLDCSTRPPPAAFAADPLTIAEIDAHPDSARLWATILAMREDYIELADHAYRNGYSDGYREAPC